VLRLALEPRDAGLRITLLKGPGTRRGELEIPWPL
jgi:hypothetical protein